MSCKSPCLSFYVIFNTEIIYSFQQYMNSRRLNFEQNNKRDEARSNQ
nr:MAG TPA: hypothetical protein [Caudoviricetes sp.]